LKSYSYILLLIILFGCNNETKTYKLPNSNKLERDSVMPFLINIDTLTINNQKIIQILHDSQFHCLLDISNDTIIPAKKFYNEIVYTDINKDNNKDIRVYVISNSINDCDNYLYNSKSKTFKLLENCFTDIKKIKKSNFYYSYTKAGCADFNWVSYLSKIENNKLVNYGFIHGQSCELDPQIIEIYKINSKTEKQILIKKLPYQKYIPKFEDKWLFIEKYWLENFSKFEE
jgi:hypothetical protein